MQFSVSLITQGPGNSTTIKNPGPSGNDILQDSREFAPSFFFFFLRFHQDSYIIMDILFYLSEFSCIRWRLCITMPNQLSVEGEEEPGWGDDVSCFTK